jgi:hypothetical protein
VPAAVYRWLVVTLLSRQVVTQDTMVRVDGVDLAGEWRQFAHLLRSP